MRRTPLNPEGLCDVADAETFASLGTDLLNHENNSELKPELKPSLSGPSPEIQSCFTLVRREPHVSDPDLKSSGKLRIRTLAGGQAGAGV